MNIVLVLIHNKGDQGNSQQIIDLLSQLTPKNANASTYSMTGVLNHTFSVIQIVPNGVNVPSNYQNIKTISSIQYGSDRPNTTGVYFNWVIRQALDLEADVVCYVSNAAEFTKVNVSAAETKLTTYHFLNNEPFGKVITSSWVKVVKEKFDDTKSLVELIEIYKVWAQQKGMVNG